MEENKNLVGICDENHLSYGRNGQNRIVHRKVRSRGRLQFHFHVLEKKHFSLRNKYDLIF